MKTILILILIVGIVLSSGCIGSINTATPCNCEGKEAIKTITPHLSSLYSFFVGGNKFYVVDEVGIRYDYGGSIQNEVAISRLTSMNYNQKVTIQYTCKNGVYFIEQMWSEQMWRTEEQKGDVWKCFV